MAEEAQGADVVEITLSAALGYGKDVVRVPQAAAATDRLHAVKAKPCFSSCASGSLEGGVGGNGIDLAGGTPAAVAGEDLVAEISGVGAQTPLVHGSRRRRYGDALPRSRARTTGTGHDRSAR